MSKSISTLVLLGVSALIVLYILSAFHKVFNRETIHEQMAVVSTDDQVQSDVATSAAAQSITSLNEQITSSAAIAAAEDTDTGTTTMNTVAVADTGTTDTSAAEEAVEESSTPESTTPDLAIDTASTPGDVLRERPHLQNALPPIPQAPPRPEGSPIVTAPSAESFSQTGNSGGSFPAPIIGTDSTTSSSLINTGSGSAFPAPFLPSTEQSTNSTQSSSSFPVPR